MERDAGLNHYFCRQDDLSCLERYLELGICCCYKKGETIIGLGEQARWLRYLKKGRAGRFVAAPSGLEKIVKVVGDKHILGEVLFFLEGGHCQSENNAIFKALEDCELYLFDRETVFTVLLKDEQVVQQLVYWFCNRMCSLNEQLVDGLVKDPHYRVCKFLYNFVQDFGQHNAQGQCTYSGKLSHYDIAKYLGINRVSVTNVLRTLQAQGIIYKERNLLILLNLAYFEQL